MGPLASWKDKRLTIAMTIITALILGVAGCASVSSTMGSWVGRHHSDLIASWGPPYQILEDGQNGKILVYVHSTYYTLPGSSATRIHGSTLTYDNTKYGTATSRTTYKPPQTFVFTSYRMFWVNQSGLIYRWAVTYR